MKAKIILYGWLLSWLCLFAGVGTMDFPASSDSDVAVGFLLCGVWVLFSLLLINNQRACQEEAEKMEAWFDKIIGAKK